MLTLVMTMPEAKTRPVSFRVEIEVLDSFEAAGLSATEFMKEAARRQATRLRQLAALRRAQEAGKHIRLPKDAVSLIREMRDER